MSIVNQRKSINSNLPNTQYTDIQYTLIKIIIIFFYQINVYRCIDDIFICVRYNYITCSADITTSENVLSVYQIWRIVLNVYTFE